MVRTLLLYDTQHLSTLTLIPVATSLELGGMTRDGMIGIWCQSDIQESRYRTSHHVCVCLCVCMSVCGWDAEDQDVTTTASCEKQPTSCQQSRPTFGQVVLRSASTRYTTFQPFPVPAVARSHNSREALGPDPAAHRFFGTTPTPCNIIIRMPLAGKVRSNMVADRNRDRSGTWV